MKRNKGFTLIELLVVISIIALLLSILMPALTKVKEQGKKVVCQSNLKQQGVACAMYQLDNDDYFPTGKDENAGPWVPEERHCRLGIFYWGGRTDFSFGSDKRLLHPYIGAQEKTDIGVDKTTRQGVDAKSKVEAVFFCPSDRGLADGGSGVTFSTMPDLEVAKSMWDFDGFSYRFNGYALNDADPLTAGLWNRRSTQVRQTSKVVLAGDASFMASNANAGAIWPYTVGYWHNKKEHSWGNLVFVDGHVGFKRLVVNDEYPNGQNGPGWTVIHNK